MTGNCEKDTEASSKELNLRQLEPKINNSSKGLYKIVIHEFMLILKNKLINGKTRKIFFTLEH